MSSLASFAPLLFGASGIGGNAKTIEAPYLGALGTLMNRQPPPRPQPPTAGAAPTPTALATPPPPGTPPMNGAPGQGQPPASIAALASTPGIGSVVQAFMRAKNTAPGQEPLPDDVHSAYQTVLLHMLGLS